MKSGFKRTYNTFSGKVLAALGLMALLPYLLVIYLFFHERITPSESVYLFSILALFSIFTGFAMLRRSVDQIHHLTREISRVESGEKKDPIEIQGDLEFAGIAMHFNSMMKKLDDLNRKNQEQATQLMVYARDLSLSYQRTKHEEELRNRISRYVGNNLVEKLIDLKDGVFLETERKHVTVLFADIRSFTAMAERMEAEEVVAMLNEYFSVMVDIIFQNGGLLDKFVGDQLIAVFGLIEAEGSHSENAIRAALEMGAANQKIQKERAKKGEDVFEAGIGINTGLAIIGNIGSENRMDYTVIGDCVNVAARLEQMAKGGEIIIGEQTFLKNTGLFNFESRGEVYVKNKLEPVICYNVLGFAKNTAVEANGK
jgi:adenylate cyclase